MPTTNPPQIDPLPVLFTVVRDTREQSPFSFTGIPCDASQSVTRNGVKHRRPLIIPTIDQCLQSGDYSIQGYENRIAIERKSLSDFFSTLGQDRERFERELVRLNQLEFAAVVVEAEWKTILNKPPKQSKLRPKTVYRSVLAWQQRYVRVHWWVCHSRQFAERTTFRILERFWEDDQQLQKAGV